MSQSKVNYSRQIIPPLEYCRVERAVKILGCEIEDLLHWAVTEEISLMLNLDQWIEPVYGRIFLEDPHYLKDFIDMEVGAWGVINGIERNHDLTDIRAWLHGLWDVSHENIKQSYLGHPLSEVEVHGYDYEDIGENGKSDYKLTEFKAIFTTDNPYPEYWIAYDDMVTVHALLTGKKKHPRRNQNQPPRGKALQAIQQLLALIPDIDSSMTADKKYEILSAKLALAGVGEFVVGSRQFRQWHKDAEQ